MFVFVIDPDLVVKKIVEAQVSKIGGFPHLA